MQKKLQRFMFLVFLVLVISEEHGNVAIVVQNFNQKFEGVKKWEYLTK